MRRTTSLLVPVVAALVVSGAAATPAVATKQPGATPTVAFTIDGGQADTNPADAWKGYGAVTANNTSRYLLDYKDEHPRQYWQIMHELFDPGTGLGLSHVKIELGSDGNTSSGTEPATMRTRDETADVLRGAGFHFAADAKSINPGIEITLLRWASPAWVTTDADRYRWYKQTIDAAYDTYGLVVDWVSPNANETNADVGWITYFAQHLKAETDERYDYAKIKIATNDAAGGTAMADDILTMVNPASLSDADKAAARVPSGDPSTAKAEATDPANVGQLWKVSYPKYGVDTYYYRVKNQTYLSLISALTHHYDTSTSPAMAILNRSYGVQIGYAEGVSGVSTGQGTQHLGLQAAGETAIDVANLFINSYANDGNPTPASTGYPTSVPAAHHSLYLYQPAVAAFPQGTTYSSKAEINALDPWSGDFDNELGYSVTRQFTAFARTGTKHSQTGDVGTVDETAAWQYVEGGASHGGGHQSGHSIVGSDSGYVTLENPRHTAFSTVLTNNSDHPVDYTVHVQNVDLGSARHLAVYETDHQDGRTFDSKWFQRVRDLAIDHPSRDGSFTVRFTMAPYSVKTITSLSGRDLPAPHVAGQDTGPENVGALDYRTARQHRIVYRDDFEYRPGSLGYRPTYGPGSSYLQHRGNTPRYSNDMSGAFEVDDVGNGNHALVQQLDYDQIPGSWTNGKPETLVGDDKWANYTVSADLTFDTTTPPSDKYKNYLGIGGRSNKQGNGYLFLLQADGHWGILQDAGDASGPGNGTIDSTNSLVHGTIADFAPARTHAVRVTMKATTVVLTIDGEQLASWTDPDNADLPMSGRIHVVSGWYHDRLDNLTVEAVPGYAAMLSEYVDDGDDSVTYSGDWTHGLSGSDALDRTRSLAGQGASFTMPFRGTGFLLQGNGGQSGTIDVVVDGKAVATNTPVSSKGTRNVGYYLTGLADRPHRLTVTSVTGGLTIDSVGVYGVVTPGVSTSGD